MVIDKKRTATDCTVDYLNARIEALIRENKFLKQQLNYLTDEQD